MVNQMTTNTSTPHSASHVTPPDGPSPAATQACAALSQNECLSALLDGEWACVPSGDAAWDDLLHHMATGDAAQTDWQLYHLVGDVLRSDALAVGAQRHGAFVARLSTRLQAEAAQAAVPRAKLPAPLDGALAQAQPLLLSLPLPGSSPAVLAPAANDGVYRWKLVAGLASVLAVAALGWQMWGVSQPSASAQLAQLATPVPQATPVLLASSDTAADAAVDSVVILRDARLDELLAAHREFGGGSALQNPNGFLRNATFETAAR
jgi:sigma-E factor negative regulatory protein RseA